MQAIFVAIALAAGGLMPVQGSINARLGKVLPHPVFASLTNFLVGTVVLTLVALALRAPWPSAASLGTIPTRLFTGGAMGAIFVSTVLVLVPRIGVLNVLAAAVVGQLLVSILIDHFGWFGVPVQAISMKRVIGAACLVAGLFLIQR